MDHSRPSVEILHYTMNGLKRQCDSCCGDCSVPPVRAIISGFCHMMLVNRSGNGPSTNKTPHWATLTDGTSGISFTKLH